MGPVSLWIYIQDYEVQGTFIIMIHDKEIKSYIVFHVQSPHNSRRGEKIRMPLLEVYYIDPLTLSPDVLDCLTLYIQIHANMHLLLLDMKCTMSFLHLLSVCHKGLP